jgi:hypothetical protein
MSKKNKKSNLYSTKLYDDSGDFFDDDGDVVDVPHISEEVYTQRSTNYKSYNNSYRNSYENYNKSYKGGNYYNSYGHNSHYNYGHREYYGGYGGWSWGSYSSILSDDDSFDKKEDFIKQQPAYITPNENKIERKLGDQSDEVYDIIRNLSKFFFSRAIDDKEYINDFWNDDSKLDDDQKSYKQQWGEIYDKYWDIQVPGNLPLDKAIYVVKEILKTQGSETVTPKVIEEWMKKNELKIDNEIYSDPIINELMDINAFSKYEKLDILEKMSLMKSFGTNFKIEKEVEPVEVYNNTKTHNRNLRSYNELMRLEPYQYALPSFKFNLARKSLRINHPLKIEEKKQVIIMLVDFSGSMCQLEKQQWVFALIIDRLKYVVKEECELYFSYFLTFHNYDKQSGYIQKYNFHNHSSKNTPSNYFEFQHIHNKETAIKFLKGLSSYPNGGDTQLGLIVDLIAKDIENGQIGNLPVDFKDSHYKPELLAIADGQDSVKTKTFSYKTNAISIEGYNGELKKMCLDNLGTYIDINGNIANIAEATSKNTTTQKTISLEKYKKV